MRVKISKGRTRGGLEMAIGTCSFSDFPMERRSRWITRAMSRMKIARLQEPFNGALLVQPLGPSLAPSRAAGKALPLAAAAGATLFHR